MGRYDSLIPKNNKNSVEAEKAKRRSQGLAVSTSDKRAAPTKGGQILRDILKVPATLLTRPAQLGAALAGRNEQQQTLKSGFLGDIKTSSNAKDVVKDVGRGLELASYGLGIGVAKNAVGAVGKESIKQIAKRGAVEGVATGFVEGVGSGVKDGKTGKDLLKNVAISTAVGGAAGAVISPVLSKLFGKKVATTVAKNTDSPNRYAELIPEAKAVEETVDDFEYVPINQSKQTPKKSLSEVFPPVGRKLKKGETGFTKNGYPNDYKPDTKLPTIQMGEVDNSSMVTLPKPVANGVGTKGSNIVERPQITVSSPDKTITPKGTEVPRVQIGEPKNVSPVVKQRQSKALSALPDDEFTPQVKETSRNFYNEDPERAFRAIEGKEPIPSDVNRKALYALAKLDAEGERAVRLAELRGISSKSGQDLSMLNQGEGNGVVDKIIEVNDALKKTLDPRAAKKAIAELKDEFIRSSPTIEDLDKLIDEITC